ncbi:fe-S cluster assembly factor HCF101, chloroplastic [Cyclospora cayetanensis]|uniref:Fe-S cluster assembly factor HCF101, chloroplastic n=1 Tax=Cyclospora cayetanensis TaxID=88456 RepID=A0A6P6RVQ7_9EIME|nr:fe-S cluster assembly factor HCF101, chloroplastic [Cyclospora cayetanensis]
MDPELLDAEFILYQGSTALAQQVKQDASDSCCVDDKHAEAPSRSPVLHIHEEVLEQLRQVKDPDIGRDIVALGFVSDLEIGKEEVGGRNVQFCLRLTTPACPFKGHIRDEAEAAVRRLPWVKEVRGFPEGAASAGRPSNLRQVGFVVGVASCKGGSGKSTIALSLALMLRKNGARVGLLDADIYGPSLPTLLTMEEARVRFDVDGESNGGEEVDAAAQHNTTHSLQGRPATGAVRRTRIEYEGSHAKEPLKANAEQAQRSAATKEANLSMLPLMVSGIKCMSYGFIAKENEQGYSALRGPFVSSVVEQLLTGTRWGALDYLVVDLPPGTGDIHITLTQQQVPLDGCVVVTTPQALSLVDAQRGIMMLKSLSIPILSVVCNMAYFTCDSCEKRHELYGVPGATQQLAELSAAQQLLVLPFDSRLNSISFAGSPQPDARDSFVDRLGPEDPVWSAIRSLADRVACELSTRHFGTLKPQPSVTADGTAVLVSLVRPERALLGEGNPVMVNEVFEISGDILRQRCKCRECTSRGLEGQRLRTSERDVVIVKLVEAAVDEVAIIWLAQNYCKFTPTLFVMHCDAYSIWIWSVVNVSSCVTYAKAASFCVCVVGTVSGKTATNPIFY